VEAIVFCGIQASGKTTFYAERLLHTHVRISMDLLRTRHREGLLLEACLESRMRFVVDNTNPTRAERARYVVPALERGYVVHAYLFESGPAEALARNAARQGRRAVPVAGLLGTRKRLEPPALAEGFAEVHRVRIAGAGFEGPVRIA
jgi:predicted kinase